MTRNTRDLSVGEAIDKLTALESEQAMARANAIEAVAVRFEDKRAAIYSRVPVELRASVDAMLDALAPKSAQSEPAEPGEVDSREFMMGDDEPVRMTGAARNGR